MHAAHLVPELALARVVTAGGPYRPGDDLSLAFTTPTVSRLVAHDAELRAKCVPLEQALVPETIAVMITHCAAPYTSGEILTLSFVDPRVARIHDFERQNRSVVPQAPSETIALDHRAEAPPADVIAQSAIAPSNGAHGAHTDGRMSEPSPDSWTEQPAPARATDERRDTTLPSPEQPAPARASDERRDRTLPSPEQPGRARATDERRDTTSPSPEQPALARACDERRDTTLPSPTNANGTVRTGERSAASPAETRLATSTIANSKGPLSGSDLGVSYSSNGAVPSQIHVGEPMTLRDTTRGQNDAIRLLNASDPAEHAEPDRRERLFDASMDDDEAPNDRSGLAVTAVHREPSLRSHAPMNAVTVRLEWQSERLRRFVQVVDKLFTIDRLGWYRHSLAMRLLIPDEIACGDMLANVEAMRHLQALRAAAVESLGKPLLAACMPGFSISSEWLDSIESSREARAIAGLRDALLPYADDSENASETPSGEAHYTTGTISRTELLAENATSVEAFLPLLIPTTSHDATLGLRLAEYRRLLIELFAQTARAGEPVRLQQMAQPNHSLDDRLWQLVGAAAEAFGGFAHA